jgi:hypothetical protein
MMKHLAAPLAISPLILSLAAAALVASAEAGEVAEWKFDDPPGTSLKSSANSVSGGGAWSANFDTTVTDGSGKLISKKPSGGIWNTYYRLPDNAPHQLWVVVELTGWNLNGAKVKEAVRAGFCATDTDDKPMVVAQAVLERKTDGSVSLRGDALGDGSTTVTGDSSPLQQQQTSPLTIVVGLDQDAGTYSLTTRGTDGTNKVLGTGKTSPGRAAKYVRFSIAGDLTDPEEQISIDRIAVTDTDPSAP